MPITSLPMPHQLPKGKPEPLIAEVVGAHGNPLKSIADLGLLVRDARKAMKMNQAELRRTPVSDVALFQSLRAASQAWSSIKSLPAPERPASTSCYKAARLMQTLNVWVEASPEPIGRLTAATTERCNSPMNAHGHMRLPVSLFRCPCRYREEPFGDAIRGPFSATSFRKTTRLERVIAREGLDRGYGGPAGSCGGRLLGSVSVLREDHPPIKRPGSLGQDYDALSEEDFADLVCAWPKDAPSLQRCGIRPLSQAFGGRFHSRLCRAIASAYPRLAQVRQLLTF